jgi:hypothetical protein
VGNPTTIRSRPRGPPGLFLSIWYTSFHCVRNSPNISCFKSRIKEKTVKSPEYYGEGSRKLSILHAILRHQCSSLNSNLYRINITNDPKCQCGAPYEDSIHYLMEVFSLILDLKHDIFGLFLTLRALLHYVECDRIVTLTGAQAD